MPQRKTRLPNQDLFGGPPMAAELGARLFGLGQFPLQLDGRRLKVPVPVRKALGEYYDQPVILSPFAACRVRIIPHGLWADYRQFILAGITDQIASEDLLQRLNATCAVCLLDREDRWNLCAESLTWAGFPKNDNGVVLLSAQFWLELYARAAWQEFLTATQQRLRDAEGVSPTMSVDPRPKSSHLVPLSPGRTRGCTSSRDP
jgi:DNA-binding transcriptional regulator/RsmH inhibitor MraZ